MQALNNYEKIAKIIKHNDGYVTRKDIDDASQSLSTPFFVKLYLLVLDCLHEIGF
jgi:hypothetical protein